MKYFIVDVFGKEKYSGNQLAVVLPDHEIQQETMQRIAAEFNFSETTFINTGEKLSNGYNVRIFCPRNEVPFAGHPTLGTAFIIRDEIIKNSIEKIVLNFKIGPITVTFDSNDDSETLWMRQIQPEFGKIYDAKEISRVINVSPDDIDDAYPVQEVSTGLPFVLVPLKNLLAVKSSSINIESYNRVFIKGREKPIFIFCPETYEPENQINCRMFAHIFGISEDPATGSANGCLAGYLVHYHYFKKGTIDVRVEQGYEINRKSLLYLKAEKEIDRINIRVGGKVIKIAQGTLL
jgi:trans-2,3-dihydro-3-hydroxyanthranilate isomerase